MKPDKKTQYYKNIRKLINEYFNLLKKSRDEGHFVEVEPYQRGWTRTFVLRDDIKNRRDVHDIRKVLDLLNSVKFSRREDFLEYSYKTGKWGDIPQPLKTLDKRKYENLSEKERSFFSMGYSRNRLTNQLEESYFFKYPYWFVYKINPNMVTHHWIPNEEFASRVSELEHKINVNNLWPVYYKSLSKSVNRGYDRHDEHYIKCKNQYDVEFDESDFDSNIDN